MLHLLLADISCVTPHMVPCRFYTPSEPTIFAEITFLLRVPIVDHLRMHLSPYDYHTEGMRRFAHLLELAGYELDLMQL